MFSPTAANFHEFFLDLDVFPVQTVKNHPISLSGRYWFNENPADGPSEIEVCRYIGIAPGLFSGDETGAILDEQAIRPNPHGGGVVLPKVPERGDGSFWSAAFARLEDDTRIAYRLGGLNGRLVMAGKVRKECLADLIYGVFPFSWAVKRPSFQALLAEGCNGIHSPWNFSAVYAHDLKTLKRRAASQLLRLGRKDILYSVGFQVTEKGVQWQVLKALPAPWGGGRLFEPKFDVFRRKVTLEDYPLHVWFLWPGW